MDIDFSRQTEDTQDQALSSAIARAGNVILTERVDRITGPGIAAYQRQRPIPLLADAARALAPAVIPDTDVVTQSWSFLPEPGQKEAPTLPAVALQVFALEDMDRLQFVLDNPELASLAKTGPRGWSGFREAMRSVRGQFRRDTAAAARALDVPDSRASLSDRAEGSMPLRALTKMYQGPGMFYLNYYGPRGTIPTIPYHEALEETEASRKRLTGKVVFVGGGVSAVSSQDQDDTYHTPYATESGDELSGVEIQATVFANLLAGEYMAISGFAN